MSWTPYFRETYFGLTVRMLSKGKYFGYPEDQPGFQCPIQYKRQDSNNTLVAAGNTSPQGDVEKQKKEEQPGDTAERAASPPVDESQFQLIDW